MSPTSRAWYMKPCMHEQEEVKQPRNFRCWAPTGIPHTGIPQGAPVSEPQTHMGGTGWAERDFCVAIIERLLNISGIKQTPGSFLKTLWQKGINSFTAQRCGSNFKSVIFNLTSWSWFLDDCPSVGYIAWNSDVVTHPLLTSATVLLV